MPPGDIETKISIDLSSYDRSMNRAISTADKLDATLDSISNTKISPIVEIDTGNLQAVKTEIESALDGTFSPKIDVDDSGLEQAIRLLNDLDSGAASIKIGADDSEITAAKRKIDNLEGESVTVDVNADTADLKEVQSQLEQLKQLAVIEVAINLAGSIPTPSDIPILNTIIAADTAARSLQATLGTGFRPGQAEQAQDLYVGGTGDSPAEAAQLMSRVIQTSSNEMKTATETGENFGAVTSQAYTVAAISGEDFNAVLAAADKLVSTGMVDSYAAGLDLIAAGFQNGMNAGDDMLDTLREYPTQFKQLGFTAAEMFNMLQTGMDAGAYNTDFIADLIKEMNIRAQAAMAGEGVEFDALSALGMLDEAEAYLAGEISGKQYAEGLAAAAKAGLADGTITQQTIFDALGTKAEDLTIPVTLDILSAQGGGIFGDVAGTTQAAGDALYGGIESSVTTAQRLIETKVADSINKAFSIQEKIDQFNAGISEFADLVQGGESITGAIEKAFNLPGLEDSVNRLESAIGNLVIELATIGANIVEGLGNKGAADDIRAGVRDMSEQQLTFDLTLARDGEDVTAAVATAVRRGVESDEVGAAMAAAGSEMLAAGDLQGLQEYVGTLESLADASIPQPVLDVLAGRGIDVTNLQAVNAELKEIQANASTGMANADWNVVQLLQSQGINLSEVAANLDYAAAADEIAGSLATDLDAALFTKFNDLFSGGKFLEGFITAIGAGEGGTAGIFGSEIVNQFKDLPNQLMTGLADIGGEIPILSTIQTDLDNTNAKVGEVMPVIGESINTNGKGTFDAFTTAINASAAAMLTQVPIIGEQNAVMQEGLITTSEEVDNLGVSAEGLNTVSLGGLMGQFAALRASAEDQLGYINIQLALLQAGLGALSGFSIDIPGIAGRSGGAHMYGGVIPQGTIGRVHGNEIMAAAPAGTDISVLNQQTSSTIESALASLVGGGAGGGSNVVNNYNNQFVYNVQSNAQGFMSEGAARSARGF